MIKRLFSRGQYFIASRKEVRYVISGAASSGIEYVSFLLLMVLTDLLYFSNSLSFILGVLSGFIFHITWSFPGEKRFKTHHQFVGYVTLAGINFVAINLLVGYFVNGLDTPPFIAKFLAICITVIWTFFLSNAVIFRSASKD